MHDATHANIDSALQDELINDHIYMLTRNSDFLIYNTKLYYIFYAKTSTGVKILYVIDYSSVSFVSQGPSL